jgi:hypothetical protein
MIRCLGIRIAGNGDEVLSVILRVIESCLCYPGRADVPLPGVTRQATPACRGTTLRERVGLGGSLMQNTPAGTPKRTED